MKRLNVLCCLLLLSSAVQAKADGAWKWDGESSSSSTGPATDSTLVAHASLSSSDQTSELNLAVAGNFKLTILQMKFSLLNNKFIFKMYR